ncbi:MAG: cell division protein FtsQ/DivIB [Pseudomonadota bacterium]
MIRRAMRRQARRAAPPPFEAPRRRRDPSPSRLRYRLDRLGRRGYVRFLLRRVAPPVGALAFAVMALQSPLVQARLSEAAQSARAALVERPEFAVAEMSVEGAAPELEARIRDRVGFEGPVSSLELDLRALRETVETTPGVATARVAVLGEGVLRVRVAQRAPALLWRWEGQLHLVDRDGVVIGPLARRADRPDLPLIVGEGADLAAAEALALWRRAAPLHDRLRALVRVGERRWTLALASEQTVHLPAEAPQTALRRLLALERAEDLLDRELSVIDLRDPERPTLRLTPRGASELQRLRSPREGEDA